VTVSEAIAAVVSGLVAIIVAMWANRRAKDAAGVDAKMRDREAQVRIDELAQRHVEVITRTYESVISELRIEVARLIDIRSTERSSWMAREQSLNDRVAQLSNALDNEREHRVRLQQRVEVLEAELAKVEKRSGYHDDDGSPTD
jgi:chromosome segregation ATPase